MSVRRASKVFGVPDSTLRDRVLNKISPDAVFGKAPLLTLYEEAKLADHLKTMASYGYGYTRQETVDLASDFSIQLGKRSKENPLSLKWITGFLQRWPELRVLKPRSLDHARARMASRSLVSEYFTNLEHILQIHNLTDKPHLIFNVDEKGVTIDHKPPSIVASRSYCPPAVTSGRGQTVTVLGCGNACGMAIPPFFVFPGKRMNQDLMSGATVGAGGTVSESGWSNREIFKQFLETHFLKFVPGSQDQKVLLILDGHKSHISVGLTEWALQHGIILFVLPAHTSHVLQPLDVSCFGPLDRMYNNK